MAGGPGYILSKAALEKFVLKGLSNPNICRQDSGGFEDAEMGICLDKLNVVYGDSRDPGKRWKFFPYAPDIQLDPEGFKAEDKAWFSDYITHPYVYVSFEVCIV
ncbi:unnamed protein product, partial [Notodromas monacha]